MTEMTENNSRIRVSSNGQVHNPYGDVSDMSWDDYERLRPTYPDKLYDLIAQYMDQHNHTDKEQCVDYGSGSGVIVPKVFERCGVQKVLATDITARQLDQGAAWLQTAFGAERYNTLLGAAGDLSSIPDKSVDLITAGEAVHWFDKPKWFAEAARILKPSGTIAFWFYWVEPFLISHPQASPIAVEAWKRFYQVAVPVELFGKDQMIYSLSLQDSLVVEPSNFGHQTRHKWLLPKTMQGRSVGHPHSVILGSRVPNEVFRAGVTAAPDCVQIKHIPETADDTFLRDTDWTIQDLRKYLEVVGVPTEKILTDDIFIQYLKKVEDIVGGPDGKFDVGWVCSLFLGTRTET